MVAPVPMPNGGVQTSSGFRHTKVARPGSAKQADATVKAPATDDAAMPSPDTVKALFAYYRSIGAIKTDPALGAAPQDAAITPAPGSAARSGMPEDPASPSTSASPPSATGSASGSLDISNGPVAMTAESTGTEPTSLYVPRPDQDPKFLYLAWDAPLKLTQASRFYGEVLKAADMFPTGLQPGETS